MSKLITTTNSWREIHAAADSMVEPWRRLYLGFFTDVNTAVDHLSILDVTNLSELDLMFSAPIEDLNDDLETKTFDLLVETMSRGADASVDAKGNLRALKVGASFDKNNSAAVTSARKQAAKLVKDVSAETRKAIRETIYQGYKDQQTVRQITKTLQNVVGMNRQQASAWQKVYGTIPNSAEAKRAAQLAVKQRALSIARTETIRASNEGQLQLWQQRIAKGLLPPTSTRVWITTPDEKLCPICAALDGSTVKMNELFEGNHKVPPAHPNCRCTIALRFSPDISAPSQVSPELLNHGVTPSSGQRPLTEHVTLKKHAMFGDTVLHTDIKDFEARSQLGVKRLNRVHSEMTRLTTEFPKLADVKIDALHIHDTNTVTTKEWGENFKASGFYVRRLNSTSVHVTLRTDGSYDKESVYLGNSRWTVGTGSYPDTLRHEVGHAVHLTHFQRIREGAQARNEWENIWGKYSKNKSLIHDTISQYAATNDKELFAESFGAYTHPAYDIQGPRFSYGGPVLKRLPDDIHNYMEKYIGKRVPMQEVGAPPIAPPIARPVPPPVPPPEVIVKPPSGKVGRQNATGFLTTVDYDNIRIRARSGDKVAEIANDFNISTTRVRGIIKAGEEKVKEIIGGGPGIGDKGPEIIKTPDNDVKPGDKKPEDKNEDTKGPKITAVMREEIIQLIKSGQSVSTVAKKYGISPTYARKLYLRSIGVAA